MSDKGYGKWIRDSNPGFTHRGWTWEATPTDNVNEIRELAAELIAWANAHDTVTLTITLDEAKSLASILGDTNRAVMVAARAARDALGMDQ